MNRRLKTRNVMSEKKKCERKKRLGEVAQNSSLICFYLSLLLSSFCCFCRVRDCCFKLILDWYAIVNNFRPPFSDRFNFCFDQLPLLSLIVINFPRNSIPTWVYLNLNSPVISIRQIRKISKTIREKNIPIMHQKIFLGSLCMFISESLRYWSEIEHQHRFMPI